MIITPIWLEKRGKQYRLAHKKEGQQVKRERCSFDEAIQTFKNVEAGAWSSKVYLEQIKAKRMINSICINTSLNKCKESFEASRKVGKRYAILVVQTSINLVKARFLKKILQTG